uniref:Uncharacterized protein n=1 Tax=Anguilla anguilla TaxID=7936 RepID=A0A0E9SX37_ANGAN
MTKRLKNSRKRKKVALHLANE